MDGVISIIASNPNAERKTEKLDLASNSEARA